VPIVVFLGLSVLDLGPMYATDRRQTQTDARRTSSLNAPCPRGGGIITDAGYLLLSNTADNLSDGCFD